MIITKKALSRRAVIKGIGATLALPFLDAMVPALWAASKSQLRVGCIYVPMGAAMCPTFDQWTPKRVGANPDFPRILQPLEPYRDQTVVFSGLSEENLGGTHLTASATWLNGVAPKKTEGPDLRSGTTLDQYLAQKIGRDTVLPSIEMAVEDMGSSIGSCDSGYSCLYQNTISWRTPTEPLPMETNPRALFERLFGGGGTPEQRRVRMEYQRSILDELTQETSVLETQLDSGDRVRLNEYLDNIREVEQRIQRTENQAASKAEVPTVPAGVPDSYEDHITLLFDLAALAWQTDLTRVFSCMMGVETNERAYPEIGAPDGHHSISHHGGSPEMLEELAKVNTFHYQMFAKFLAKLRATPDGDGNLLDHSILLYGSGMSNPNIHQRDNLPLVVVGGGAGRIKGNRHLQYPRFTPHCNLLLAIAEKADVELQSIGDSSGPVDL